MHPQSKKLKGVVRIWQDKLTKTNMLHLIYAPCKPPWRPCRQLTQVLKSDILESKARGHIEKVTSKEYQITIRFAVR